MQAGEDGFVTNHGGDMFDDALQSAVDNKTQAMPVGYHETHVEATRDAAAETPVAKPKKKLGAFIGVGIALVVIGLLCFIAVGNLHHDEVPPDLRLPTPQTMVMTDDGAHVKITDYDTKTIFVKKAVATVAMIAGVDFRTCRTVRKDVLEDGTVRLLGEGCSGLPEAVAAAPTEAPAQDDSAATPAVPQQDTASNKDTAAPAHTADKAAAPPAPPLTETVNRIADEARREIGVESVGTSVVAATEGPALDGERAATVSTADQPVNAAEHISEAQ